LGGVRALLVRSSLGAIFDARGGVMSELLLDAAGRCRSPATLPQFHAGRPPRNKAMRYLADPKTIEEIVTVMRHAGDSVHGRRLRGLIVVLPVRRVKASITASRVQVRRAATSPAASSAR
jgi:hypothetical protein